MEAEQETIRAESRAIDPSLPVIFLGIADGITTENPVSPLEACSIFKLARFKLHFAFPAIQKQAAWCFLINIELFASGKDARVQIVNSNGVEIGHVGFSGARVSEASAGPRSADIEVAPAAAPGPREMIALDRGQWILQGLAIKELLITEPGEYSLLLQFAGKVSYLGRVIYLFAPPPPLSDEQISALESDPVSPAKVVLTLGCKQCDSKLKAYAAVKKSDDLTPNEYVFYQDLPDKFLCKCGKTDINLVYLRKGMHGFLGRAARAEIGELSYVQRYAHSQLLDIAGKFLGLLQKEKQEEVIQKFLENNKVLLARFHAGQLFIKPRILGKFNSDFAILDSEGVLKLIEIERPTIRLFKKNGHLTSEFNHAYEQVQDWLDEVSKHRYAVIDGLGLKHDQVLSIRGCVIAGRSKLENREHLRRHMSQPRPNIEFLTLDMLAHSLTSMASDLP